MFLYQATLSPSALDQLVTNGASFPTGSMQHLLSLFTSMFLHGGWLHLIGNMLYLWVFGRNVEDLIGGAKFLLFICCAGSLREWCT